MYLEVTANNEEFDAIVPTIDLTGLGDRGVDGVESTMALLDWSARYCIAGFRTHAAFDRYPHCGFLGRYRILDKFGLGKFETTNGRAFQVFMEEASYKGPTDLWFEHTNVQ